MMTNRHTYRTLAQYFFDTEDTDFALRAGVEADFDNADDAVYELEDYLPAVKRRELKEERV
jgi:hypothetical protein